MGDDRLYPCCFMSVISFNHTGASDGDTVTAFSDDKEIGYIRYYVNDNFLSILTIEINEDFQRQGYGTALCENVRNRYPSVYVTPYITSQEGKKFAAAVYPQFGSPRSKL